MWGVGGTGKDGRERGMGRGEVLESDTSKFSLKTGSSKE